MRNKLIDIDYSYIQSVLAGLWADGVCEPPSKPAAKKEKNAASVLFLSALTATRFRQFSLHAMMHPLKLSKSF